MKTPTLLLLALILFSCKKEDNTIAADPLHKRWYAYKIERIYTDKNGAPHKEYESRSNVVDDKELFIEFTADGRMLTYEGNGTYTRTGNKINFRIHDQDDSYDYVFQNEMLILSTYRESETFNERSVYSMKVL